MSDDPNPPAPMSSPVRDIRRLKQNGAASAEEFREFLQHLRGRSPKEVLGTVASSNLFQSLIIATIAMAVLIASFTITPWLFGKAVETTKEDVVAEAAEEEADATTTSGGAETATEGVPGIEPEPGTSATTPPGIDAAIPADAPSRLGVGETLDAPTNVNPLEGATDDLLKDLGN